jgi:hypothetical protein
MWAAIAPHERRSVDVLARDRFPLAMCRFLPAATSPVSVTREDAARNAS